MDFRKIFFGFLILVFSNQVSAQMDTVLIQTDTTDTLTISDFLYQYDDAFAITDTVFDSSDVIENVYLIFENIDTNSGQISLHFTFSDTSMVEFIQVELSLLQDEQIKLIQYKIFDLEDFIAIANYDSDNVEYIFDDIDSQQIYKVSILITGSDGLEYPIVKKLFIP